EWGLYVELEENKCEGMIRLRDLNDDYYEYDQKNFCIVGHRSRKKYSLGDELMVVIKSTDIIKKQVDFMLYDKDRLHEVSPFKRSDKKRFPSSGKIKGDKRKSGKRKR
ncbi:MAG: ribonuclease R, partial [Bacteroidia bacterium]|nr:ribonuclease R [Bacteroidia bacterium]